MTTETGSSFDLSGKVAVVTGGARGIGLATVKLLQARGARIVASDVSPAVGDLAASDVATFCGDVSEEETAVGTIALALKRFGSVDILVNNAGRTMNKPLIDMSVGDWDQIMAVNARGNFLHSREAVKVMIGQGAGVLVSVASIVSAAGMKDTSVYAASKGAIAQLTKVIAVEYGGVVSGPTPSPPALSSPIFWTVSSKTAGPPFRATAAPIRLGVLPSQTTLRKLSPSSRHPHPHS